MQGIAEAIKYLYQQFILRDVVAYVTPGTILAASILKVLLGTEHVIDFVQGIPKIAYVPIYGLLFVTGLALENIGEVLKILPETERANPGERFEKLQDFHRATALKGSVDQRNDYGDSLERMRERIEVKKYASGNIALALVISAILIWVTKIYPQSNRWAVAAVGAILVASLVRSHRRQLKNATIWEDIALDCYPTNEKKRD
jgi:hypothetical protein